MEEIPQFLGVARDMRPPREKARDFTNEEFGSVSEIQWKEKKKFRKFTPRDQAYSSSCGAQSAAKMAEINEVIETANTIVFSATPIYRGRSNFPSGGMTILDVLKSLTKEETLIPEAKVASQKLSEEQMNTMKFKFSKEDKEFARRLMAGGYENITKITMDSIAEQIALGRGVLLMLYFSKIPGANEYWKYEPQISVANLNLYDDDTTSRHFVVAVDYFINDGKKYLVIEDSAGPNSSKKGQRILSEDFVLKRAYGCGYSVDKKNMDIDKPSYTFTKTLTFGLRNNAEVVELQKILQYEKFLPTHINGKELPLGNYLAQTSYGVLQFQKKYQVAPIEELERLRGMTLGPKTRAKLNELYGTH